MAVIRTYQLSVFGNCENSSNFRSVHRSYTYFSFVSQSCDLRIEFGQSSSFESYQHVSFYLRSSYINSPRVFKSCEPLRKIQSKSNSSIASVYPVPFVGHKEHHFANSYLSTGSNCCDYQRGGSGCCGVHETANPARPTGPH